MRISDWSSDVCSSDLKAVELARLVAGKGFKVVATHGTAALIRKAGIECKGVNKVKEGRPHCVDMIKNGEIQFIANTTEGKQSIEESRSIRGAAFQHKICYFTTIGCAGRGSGDRSEEQTSELQSIMRISYAVF